MPEVWVIDKNSTVFLEEIPYLVPDQHELTSWLFSEKYSTVYCIVLIV